MLSPLIHSLGCLRSFTGLMLTDRSHMHSTGNDISFRDRKIIVSCLIVRPTNRPYVKPKKARKIDNQVEVA